MIDEPESPPMSERGIGPIDPPVVKPPGAEADGCLTPLPRPEPPPPMPIPPPPPQNRQAVVVDQAASGTCHLCGKPAERPLLISYRATPLISAKIAACVPCLRDLVLTEMDRRRKHAEAARRAEDEAEDRRHGFGKREIRELVLAGWMKPGPQKMSPEFIDAAVRVAGCLRNDYYLGRAHLSNATLRALTDLLESLGERQHGVR